MTLAILNSWSMAETMNTLIPTGGVTAPMVVTNVIQTPNQMGSYPRDLAIGKKNWDCNKEQG